MLVITANTSNFIFADKHDVRDSGKCLSPTVLTLLPDSCTTRSSQLPCRLTRDNNFLSSVRTRSCLREASVVVPTPRAPCARLFPNPPPLRPSDQQPPSSDRNRQRLSPTSSPPSQVAEPSTRHPVGDESRLLPPSLPRPTLASWTCWQTHRYLRRRLMCACMMGLG